MHAAALERLREGWFWAGILQDHAGFIHDYLAPDQTQWVAWARGFQEAFAALQEEAARLGQAAGLSGPAGSLAGVRIRRSGGPTAVPAADLDGQLPVGEAEAATARLNGALLEQLGRLVGFKQQLLQQRLDCQVKLHLPPSLLQHMINEAEEAFRWLGPERSPEPPAMAALRLHLLWLPDASGHADILNKGLDPTEQQLDTLTRNYRQVFDGLHLRALELHAMLRVAPRLLTVLRRLNLDVETQIGAFRAFLSELREHLAGCSVAGTQAPELADHMLREEMYYLEKLAAVVG